MRKIHTINQYFNEHNSLVNTKLNHNFQNWFGRSKTLKGGVPLVFLHGTNEKFNEFSKKRRGAFGIGYYFTTDPREASGYGSKIMRVYLKIENPASTQDVQNIMTDIPDVRYLDDYELATKTTELLIEKGHDGLLFTYPNSDLLAMVINESQIKSIDNKGLWDITNNNIYE